MRDETAEEVARLDEEKGRSWVRMRAAEARVAGCEMRGGRERDR